MRALALLTWPSFGDLGAFVIYAVCHFLSVTDHPIYMFAVGVSLKSPLPLSRSQYRMSTLRV